MKQPHDLHLAVLAFLTKHSPMSLENRTWFVELGPAMFDSSDFTPRALLTINGIEVGKVNMDALQDYTAIDE